MAGVPEHFNMPWLLGLERRAFVRAGVEVRWRTVPEGTGAMCKLLREGEVDLAMLVTEGAVRDILNGNPSRIISSYVDSPLTWGVHVAAHTGERITGAPAWCPLCHQQAQQRQPSGGVELRAGERVAVG